jgi:cytochrome c oxidase subunit 2
MARALANNIRERGNYCVRVNPALLLITLAGVGTAKAAPLQYLTGHGAKAAPVVALTWGVLLIAVTVIVIVALLLAGAIWHRPALAWVKGARDGLQSHEGGLEWLWIGVGLTGVALLFTIGWTVKVLADIARPPGPAPVSIEVTGRQWWWQVRYMTGNPSREFLTANEIHIPVGKPVRLKLVGGDVIHSFWIPQLAGKMDAIPGQTNETWIEADAPGVYRGQCTEYCGLQHSHMGVLVVAESEARFRQWWAHQLDAPPAPQGIAAEGQPAFAVHCGGCHAVRGTQAAGTAGPDLSHLRKRLTLAAGTLKNDPASLMHWVSDPQSVKPGSLMPTPAVSGHDLVAITAYLESLE